jgi:hypothetical protein
MIPLGFARRRLLEAAGASLLVGPLSRLLSANAAPAAPRRLVCIFTPNGIHGEAGLCNGGMDTQSPWGGPATGTENDFQLGRFYTPLEPFKKNAVVMSRLTWAGPQGWGHIGGSRGPFTAWKGDTANDLPKVASVDQFIAGELQRRGQITAKRNLHLSIGGVGGGTLYAPFWSASEVVAVPSEDPAMAYANLVGGAAGGDPKLSRTVRGRKAILDRSLADCEKLKGTLDRAGKDVVELHCANLKALSSTIDPSGGKSQCASPPAAATSVAGLNFKDPTSYPKTTEYFMNLITGAFACDLTRVATFQFGGGAARLRMPFLGLAAAKQVDGYVADDHHTWTHHNGTADEKNAALLKINNWYSEVVVKLLTNLATTKDASGAPLLDNTAVLWLNEYGTGCQTGHDLLNIPGFLFTGANEIKTGRYLRLDHKYSDHKGLLTSMCHFMGLKDVKDYGFNGDIKGYDKSGTGPGIQMSEGPFARLYG